MRSDNKFIFLQIKSLRVPLQQRQDHSSVEMWLDRFERTHSDLIIMKTEEFRDKTLKEIADVCFFYFYIILLF